MKALIAAFALALIWLWIGLEAGYKIGKNAQRQLIERNLHEIK